MKHCPGSGSEGEVVRHMLVCPACNKVVAVWPPMTVPVHDR